MPAGPSHSPSFSPFPHSPALPTHNHLDPLPGSIRTSAIEMTGMQKPPPAHHPPSNNFGKPSS
ncbi:hypothetical protein PGTUg99_031889 [Puccinia graminis f. sp. tritici]|uniref:Uncharacterized protein n=1 Tax=Puccinia graminis f. sp. tritici TaxID=56615 RepID=A0A5B0RAS5_PUCGR|nr:hypothetical protein PGTUg99_031889 [Puccinia graminis f. sp. tritici]